MAVTVDLARCVGSRDCVSACAFAAVEVREGKAVIFDNCTECGACVLACPTHALASDLFSAPSKSRFLGVDFTASSGIATTVERAARDAEAQTVWSMVDATDAGAAADALAAFVQTTGYSLVVLPHSGAGPAVAARLAARLRAALLAGCVALRIDESGSVRAVRSRFNGLVKLASRCAPGITVATMWPRGVRRVSADALSLEAAQKVAVGEKLPVPPGALRRIVSLGPNLSDDAERAATACAEALGAAIVDLSSVAGKQLAPDLYVAFGVNGSTEHNSAFRGSRVVVAVVEDANAPIAQIADYLLVGAVGEHAMALAAAL